MPSALLTKPKHRFTKIVGTKVLGKFSGVGGGMGVGGGVGGRRRGGVGGYDEADLESMMAM
jgi:hypothetical protein